MNVGDLVKFTGFSGVYMGSSHPIGLIVHVHRIHNEVRYDVIWPNGSIGNWLYADTLTVICSE